MDSGLMLANHYLGQLQYAMRVGQVTGQQFFADMFMIEMLQHGVSARKTYEIADAVQMTYNQFFDNYWAKDTDVEKTESFTALDRMLQPATERAGQIFIPYWKRYEEWLSYVGCCEESQGKEKTQEFQGNEKPMERSVGEKAVEKRLKAVRKKLKTTRDPALAAAMQAIEGELQSLLEELENG